MNSRTTRVVNSQLADSKIQATEYHRRWGAILLLAACGLWVGALLIARWAFL